MEERQKLDILSPAGVSLIYKDVLSLDPADEDIRVIYLEGAPEDSPIECTLHKKALRASPVPEYHALSYTWGDSNDRREIVLNGYVVTVTFNLYSALRHLRKEEGTMTLWVDAVCINQLDLDERGRQVGMMGKIYSLCKSTIVWLGEPTEDFLPTYPTHWSGDERDDDLIAWMWDNFYDYATKPDFNDSDPGSVDWIFHGMAAIRLLATGHVTDQPLFTDHTGEDFVYPLGYHEYCHYISKALSGFFDSPWWTRVWTVQEVILPTEALLIYGPVSVNLSFLIKAFDTLSNHMLSDCCSEYFSSSNQIMRSWIRKLGAATRDIELLRTDRQKGTEVELWESLVRFRERHATDNRDKIYGVLGMVDSWPSGPVIPNYRTTVNKVFCQATLLTAIDKKSLLPLHYPLERHKQSDLPSWAVDWTAASELSDEINRYQFTQELFLLFKQPEEVCHIVPLADDTVLQVKGRRCDRVASVGALCQQKGRLAMSRSKRQVYCDWFRLARLHEDPSRPYKTGCTNFDAFWRCLCWDLVMIIRDGKAIRNRSKGDQSYEAFVSYCRSSLKSIFHPEGLSVDDRRAILEMDPRFAVPEGNEWNTYSPPSFLAEQLINGLTVNMVMFETDSGYLGMGPKGMEVGDEVWCLFGGWMPFVLRPTGKTRNFTRGGDEVPLWRVMGISYVHGIMDGEVGDNQDIPVEMLYLM